MATNIVKCKHCNIVINEVLAFVHNKLEVMDEESLVRICVTAFSVEEIESAKNLLFNAIPTKQRNISRKRSGKSSRDLYDLISVLKQADPDEIPMFVAKELHKLPPITFDHVDVTRLLKDILVLQKDIADIKNTYVPLTQFNEVKNELKNLKKASIVNTFDLNINQKRGGSCKIDSFCLDSGPVGLAHFEEKTNVPGNCNLLTDKHESSERVNDLSLSPRLKTHDCVSVTPSPDLQPLKVIDARIALQTSNIEQNEPQNISACPKLKTFAETISGGEEWKHEKPNQDWILVQRKRLANRLVALKGKAEPNTKFKAADKLIPLLINYVDKGTSESDITDYILQKTNISITMKKITMKTQKFYDAYKIFVPYTKLSLFLNDALWPEGIQFRRFVYFNRNKYDENFENSNKNDQNESTSK